MQSDRKIGYILLLLWMISAGTVQGQETKKYVLTGSWKFQTDLYDQGKKAGWYKMEWDDAHWDSLSVPGVWDTQNEYADYVGAGWYRHRFQVPVDWREKHVRLVFEAVYNNAEVWLNGHRLGEHHVGFLPFHFEVSAYLQFGGENVLVVRADNTFKRGAIWNWGGIRRPVWLKITEPVHLEYLHVMAVPNLQTGEASVELTFEVNNHTDADHTIAYAANIGYQGEVLWERQNRKKLVMTVPANTQQKANIKVNLPKEQVNLWHFNFPHLYDAAITIYENGQPLHRIHERFGIRKVEVDGLTLKLNGEPIRPVGMNLVPEDRTQGSTLPLWRIREDVDMMKSIGVNMARLSHLPLPEDFLDYLDEKGIMVFEEVALWGKDEMVDPDHPLPEYWLEKMIQVKYNHPSVIGWSVGNEIGFLDRNPKVMEYVQSAIQQAKSLDPHRLAVYISHSAARQAVDPVKYSDMILFNAYGNWGEAADEVHRLHPGKPIFFSEIGSALNHENPNLGVIDADKILGSVRHKQHVIGASLWTFNDYRSFWKGSPTWTTPPSQNRTWGIVTTFREPKKAYYTFRKEYLPLTIEAFQSGYENRETGKEATATITLQSRAADDFPAYTVKDYRLVWSVIGRDGQLTGGEFITIPTLAPGKKTFSHTFHRIAEAMADPEDGGQSLRVEILDPQGYAVYDTAVFLQPPPSPEIVSLHTGVQGVRVVFEKSLLATSYTVKYGTDGLAQETESTINNFVDIPDLAYGERIQLQVVAHNNAGQTGSEVATVTVDEDELPPVIWHTAPADGKFFVGYTVDREDYLYEIEYGTSPGEYTHHLVLRNFGVLQVPGLQNGTTYYYRLRRRRQWGFASEWTHEVAVTPGSMQSSVQPKMRGVIRQGKQALLLFEPVPKAVGYQVQVSGKDTREITINGSKLHHILINDLDQNTQYQFTLQAIRQSGSGENYPLK